MLDALTIRYEHTNIPYKIHKYLNEMSNHSRVAWDFETANKLTAKELELLSIRFKHNPTRETLQHLTADGLSHPSLTCITHLSVAWTPTDAIVIVCDTDLNRRIVYDWLVTADNLHIVHRASFDFRHVLYHTGKLPKHYTDTQLLAKSLINDVNTSDSLVGLKELMGHKYGDWAIADDMDFTLENMHNPKMIKYSAIDSMATIALYIDIQNQLASF